LRKERQKKAPGVSTPREKEVKGLPPETGEKKKKKVPTLPIVFPKKLRQS